MAVSHAIMTPLYYLWRNRKSWQIMNILLTVPRTTSTDLSICSESLIRMKETWHECKYYCQKSSWMGASCRKHEQFFLPWITWFSLCWKHDSLSKFVAKIAVQHSFMGKKKRNNLNFSQVRLYYCYFKIFRNYVQHILLGRNKEDRRQVKWPFLTFDLCLILPKFLGTDLKIRSWLLTNS